MELTGRPSDQDLWGLVRARDGDAFAGLYSRHAARVHAHLRQRTDPAEAEDLVADVFVIAWQKQGDISFDQDAGMLPWLLMCANNVLRNQQRSRTRRRHALARVPINATAMPDVADDVVDREVRADRATALRAVLDQLSVNDRELLQMCVVQGLTPTVVAAASGQPAGTVRSQLSRALAKARSLYAARTSPVFSVGEGSS